MSELSKPLSDDERAELEYLRRRVAELDGEMLAQARRANAAVAAAQERAYWLDRWQVDLNGVMTRPGAERFRATARLLRGPVRRLRRLKSAIAG